MQDNATALIDSSTKQDGYNVLIVSTFSFTNTWCYRNWCILSYDFQEEYVHFFQWMESLCEVGWWWRVCVEGNDSKIVKTFDAWYFFNLKKHLIYVGTLKFLRVLP